MKHFSCPIPSAYEKDARFQELLKEYPKFSASHLATTLELCRQRYGYEDDWFPDTPAKKAIFTKFRRYHLTFEQLSSKDTDLTKDSLYNLYSTLYSLYSPEMLDHRLSHIAYYFERILDKTAEEHPSLDRQTILETLGDDKENGFKKVMRKVWDEIEKRADEGFWYKAFYDEYYKATGDATKAEAVANIRKRYRAAEYKKMLANKERLTALVAPRIGEEEGFIVNIQNFEVDFERPAEEEDAVEEGQDNDSENEGEDKTEGTKGERYGDFRTVKLMESLSPQVKRFLRTIPKINSEGRVAKDDLGVVQRVGTRQAAIVLKRVLQDSTPETMMDDLKSASDSYPWIRGLVDALENDTDMQTLIYSLKGSASTYVYTNLEDGSYKSHIANTKSAGYALAREAGNNLMGGNELEPDTSIYTGYGALKSREAVKKIRDNFSDLYQKVTDAFENIRMVTEDEAISDRGKQIFKEKWQKKYGESADWFDKDKGEAAAAFFEDNPTFIPRIVDALRGLGFQVTEEDIKTIAQKEISGKTYEYLVNGAVQKKGRNYMYHLVGWIDSAYKAVDDIWDKGQEASGEYLYNTTDVYTGINKCLAISKYNELEDRVLNEGKSLSTINNTNLLHQITDELANKRNLDEMGYLQMLNENYNQYEGMALGFGNDARAVGWIKRLADDKNWRKGLRVVTSVGFNHVEYARMTKQQKITSALMLYFNGNNMFGLGGKVLVEVPIQADYETAYDFITCKQLSRDDIVSDLVDEVLVEVERIASIQQRQRDNRRAKLEVYEKQGLKFQIFPEFNSNGFLSAYTKIEDAEEAKRFVENSVREQLDKIVTKDRETITKSGVLTNPLLQKVGGGAGVATHNFYTEDGNFDSLAEENQSALDEYFINSFYHRMEMTKIFTGGLQQFDGLIDYEKRNMMLHAPHTSLYTKATWNGERVGKDTQRVVYINDDKSASAVLDSIQECLQQLKDEKVISDRQYKTMLSAYTNINTTDGQGFRTLESYRTTKIMAGEWDKIHERAYQRIMAGNPKSSDIQVFMQNIKPIFSGYETIAAAEGLNQKPVKNTVLHKYSEAVLLPLALAEHCLQVKSAPIQALSKAQAELKKKGQDIDMFLFHSGCKVGAHSTLSPFAKWKDIKGDKSIGESDEDARKARGWNGQDVNDRIISSVDEMSDYIVNTVMSDANTVHTLDFKYYGIAASTPVHLVNDKISWASQAEKVAWANVEDGDKITIRGKKRSAKAMRELYSQIKTASIIETYNEIREIFSNPAELERIFQEELASKSYNSRELTYALARLKDGSFALPLFSPNVEHQVAQLFSSIIKKRLTKPRAKGSNILQATGLGMDAEAHGYDESNSLSEKDKLSVVWEGTGKNKRIKYVEVYMPLHDSRLEMFADSDGVISAERLKQLIDDGTIPEDILKFVAYRTPSDAEHSVIPCRIKGFIANTGGATIIMPKEVMVMTGHDYDGDKMRCHFPNFSIGWNEDKIRKEFDKYNKGAVTSMMRQILGLETDEKPVLTYEAFAKKFKNAEKLRMSNDFRAVRYTAYDYDKSAIENSQEARDNAKIELMFAKLTSPEGTRKMLIPGGCEDTSVIAKTMYLVRLANDTESRTKIQNALISLGVSEDRAKSAVHNTNELYNMLTRMNDKQVSDVVRAVSDSVSPFTVSHESDAFETIMGGAELIGIYALYNSAFQMFQRIDLRYVQKQTKKGKSYDLSLFGHKWGDDKEGLHLFNVKNHNGRLASLALARLVNAAVDNNKNPILGYLNQSKDMAEITFMMLAAGMTEEEVHLITNQPAVIELINRLKGRESEGIDVEAMKIINQLTENKATLKAISASSPYVGVQEAAKITRDDYIRMLSIPFERVDVQGDDSIVTNQVAILQTLRHINSSAKTLAQFVRLTRPETDSGSIDSSVEGIIADNIELNDFRQKLNRAEKGVLNGISGMRDIMERRRIEYGYSIEAIEELLGTDLPEVVSLNSLMIDSSLDIFSSYYPQARSSWVNVAAELAEKYSYNTIQPGVIKKITTEMILWKLLSDKRFVQGDPQEEQRRIIVDVPANLKKLKQRIAKAEKEKGKDPAAAVLVGNVFLDNLSVRRPTATSTPRLRFTLNGPAIEGTSDLIRASWSELLASDDESIRQLGIDLFKYNMYTNGFGYGMYEFAHFAPFSVILSTPGYREALRDILIKDWSDEADLENFINQYYMNHWGDNKFLKQYAITDLNVEEDPDGETENLVVSDDEKGTAASILTQRYVIITSGKNNKTQTLYRVEKSGNDAVLIKAKKLGVRNKNQQVTLQYNPAISYLDIEPVVTGNDSAWGNLEKGKIRDPFAQANIDAPNNGIPLDENYYNTVSSTDANRLRWFGAKKQVDVLKMKEEKAAAQEETNSKEISNDTTESGLSKSEDSFARSFSGFGSLAQDADLSAARVSDGQMLSIVTETPDGKVETSKVPATPDNIRQARKQENFVRLNRRLREILRKAGVEVGVLTDAEAMMSIGGIADFDTAKVTAEGLVELIRIANGYRGEQALPEEFAHVALEMLGHDNPLVKRLLDALYNNREAMEEAFEGNYAEYERIYGKDNMDKLVLEAAGKLVAKNLLREQEIQNRPIRNLIHRIVEAIKNLLRKFRKEDVQDAILDADRVASKVARDLLSGRLLDSMSLENIATTDKLYATVKKDLTQKEDLLSKLLKIEVKRLSIFKKRYGYDQSKGAKSLAATELQISKLEQAIVNYKTEDAVVTYMQDSLLFLAQTSESLDKVVSSGRPANIVCRKLNTVRDTLYSFSAALEAIDKAIQDNEIQDTANIRDSINKMSGVLNAFHTRYETIARSYFEDMLSNVYGEHGITVTVGKDKGRTISIHEMATKTDGNISLAARWFNSLADCNDFALKAIDDLTRSVKIDARNRMLDVMPKIELAVSELKKETGSTDQDFMFEKDENGKRTGRYISEEAAGKLSPARLKFYKTMMGIKHQADDCLPESLVDSRKMVMMRKYNIDRIKAAEGAKGKLVAAWEGVKNSVMDMSDDIDFDNKEVAVDFEGNKVDMLPVKFCLKGKKESYEDMSDDVASSIAAYAGMAFEYDGLNGVINILENAKYMASEREVLQKTGTRKKRETIETEDYIYHKPFTVKQANTRIQDLLEDFFQMHIYGHLQKAEGTFGRTRLSKRKVVDTVNNLTSMSQMAINLPQRIANVNTGLTQIFIESIGKGVFNVKDVAWASKIYIKESGDRLAETGKTDVDNKLSLFAEYFDLHQNNGRNQVRYDKGRMARIFNQSLLYAGLTAGEDYLALTTALATARNFKVKSPSGKTETLWDAYEVKYLNEANKTGAYLSLKKGYTKEDGSAITADDEKRYGKLVAGMNFQLQGIYNTDDRSAVQQYAFGALIIMYRKWIAPALKRRYAGAQYNALRGDFEEGYYRTLFRIMGDIVKDTKNQVSEEESVKNRMNILEDMKALRNSALMNWKNLTPYEKSNVKRSFAELSVIIGLYAACALASSVPPSDDDDDRGKMLKWWDKTVLSQMFRLRSEIGSQAPTPMMVDEAMHILNSPFAAIQPLQNAMNSFQLLIPSNYFTEIKAGRYKGHSKAYKYFRELPVISMFKKVDNFLDPSPLINYYKNDAL